MEYTLIRSKRKTMAIEIRNGNVIVRAPERTTQKRIDGFVLEHEAWIERKLAQNKENIKSAEKTGLLTKEEKFLLAEKAKQYIPQRVEVFAKIVGVTYGKITIRCQKTRWGSCSAKGNLNFNLLLMLMPEEVVDSVIVHELCHRREMNHSIRFYAAVQKAYPNYDKWNKWLKEHGSEIMARVE